MKSPLFALASGLLVLSGAASAQNAPIPPGFVPSKFPGVGVRHVPAPPSRTTAARVKHDGIKLSNIRRARDKRNGVIADIDPYTAPDQTAKVARKKRHHKTR